MSFLMVGLTLGLLLLAALSSASRLTCIPKDYNNGIACLCNSTYCDTVEEVGEIEPNTFVTYTTSRDGLRLEKATHTISDTQTITEMPHVDFTVDYNIEYQEIFGFGGAMTDAAGFNIDSLKLGARENLLKSYFSPIGTGIGYSIIRVPIGASDFSNRSYSYDDVAFDQDLVYFNLTIEDHKYKIPFIQQAMGLNSQLRLFCSAWRGPSWMLDGFGCVNSKYYETWAKYIIKFLKEYEKAQIIFWTITSGNEPTTAAYSDRWSPDGQSKWLKNWLIPLLKNDYDYIKIFICDDQTPLMGRWQGLLGDPVINAAVRGIATHGYTDSVPLEVAIAHAQFNSLYPNKAIMCSEVSVTTNVTNPLFTAKTAWGRAELYASNILLNLGNWANAWVDWNLVLDLKGGPNYLGNLCDAPIRVNATADEFYKQPMFYAVGQFSTFIPPGSRRVELNYESPYLSAVAFKTPEPFSRIVVVILNKKDWDYSATVSKSKSEYGTFDVPKRSIVTAIMSTTPTS